MSIGTGIVRAIALQQVDNAPDAEARAQRDIIGHHDLTKKQLAAIGVLYNSYGMMLGYTQDKCVLRVSRSSLGKGKKGRKKFEEYYNTKILSYKELAASYNVPMQFGSRDETRKSQYDLMWLVFAAHWLHGFLGKAGELGKGSDHDLAQQAANDLVQKVNADNIRFSHRPLKFFFLMLVILPCGNILLQFPKSNPQKRSQFTFGELGLVLLG